MSHFGQMALKDHIRQRFGAVLGFDTAKNAYSTSELGQI
jgi:hypothetical protein